MRNSTNLIPNSARTKTELSEMGRKGGTISGEMKRQRKTIAEVLRYYLQQPSGVGDLSNLDVIVRQAVEYVSNTGDVKDLKVLCEILGETKQKVETNAPILVVTEEMKRVMDEFEGY